MLFFVAFLLGLGLFSYRVWRIVQVIRLGKPSEVSFSFGRMVGKVVRYALIQEKMFQRPIPALLHYLVFAGFFIVNLEMVEVFVDALTDEHRFFARRLGEVYPYLVSFLELFAVFVIIACVIFILRRTVVGVRRFRAPEIDRHSWLDALFILVAVPILMVFILLMNGADWVLIERGVLDVAFREGRFWLSSLWAPAVLGSLSEGTLHVLSRVGWWGHNLLMFGLLAYLPHSKHLHMVFSFVNVALTPEVPRGAMRPLPEVQKVLQTYLGVEGSGGEEELPERFGAKDVPDLPWKSILDAFTCTECGRCTSECPANLTGKKLSPRKIVMNVRDRAEEILRYWAKNGRDGLPEGSLFSYISREELYACTTCQACVEACPVNINPLTIILEMRRYLALDAGQAPREWTLMFSNLENNGAPWQFPPEARVQWLRSPQQK